MKNGVRLILSLDGIGLDVDAKLDQSWETLTLVFNGVEKTIRLGGVQHVSVHKNPEPYRRLEQLEASSDPCWAVRALAQNPQSHVFGLRQSVKAVQNKTAGALKCFDPRPRTGR